jgi:hypothetical protein
MTRVQVLWIFVLFIVNSQGLSQRIVVNTTVSPNSFVVLTSYNEIESNVSMIYNLVTNSNSTSLLVIDFIPYENENTNISSLIAYPIWSVKRSNRLVKVYNGTLSGAFSVVLVNENILDSMTFYGTFVGTFIPVYCRCPAPSTFWNFDFDIYFLVVSIVGGMSFVGFVFFCGCFFCNWKQRLDRDSTRHETNEKTNLLAQS